MKTLTSEAPPKSPPPEEIVDVEVTRIASENLTASDGLGAAATVLWVTSNDADQEGGAEV
jgi:hypothetical protein